MINKHTLDYHPSHSQLISKVHPLIFLWTRKGFISLEFFLNFFPNLYTPPWLWRSFKFIVFRLLANIFVSQKIKSLHFYSCPRAKLSPRFLSLSPREKEITHSSRAAFSEDISSSAERGGEKIMEFKKLPKLTRVLVLLNPIIFATFTFLVYVLLCNNLASSMLKCEGSLT